MASVNTHRDTPGRILAALVFLIGVGLLCLVFGLAWSLFRSPVPGLELPVKAGAAAPPAEGIGIGLTEVVRQLLLLALMTVSGSVIAGKGIHLYYSAAQSATPAAPQGDFQNGRNGRGGIALPVAPADAATQKPPG